MIDHHECVVCNHALRMLCTILLAMVLLVVSDRLGERQSRPEKAWHVPAHARCMGV